MTDGIESRYLRTLMQRTQPAPSESAAPVEALQPDEPMQAKYPECSGNPNSCPENEGFGCCGRPPKVDLIELLKEAMRFGAPLKNNAAYKRLLEIFATPPAAQGAEPTDSYVQTVPDKCDRIVWRNQYFHLPQPVNAGSGQAVQARPRMREMLEMVEKYGDLAYEAGRANGEADTVDIWNKMRAWLRAALSIPSAGAVMGESRPAFVDPAERATKFPDAVAEVCPHCQCGAPGWSKKELAKGYRWKPNLKEYHCTHASVND